MNRKQVPAFPIPLNPGQAYSKHTDECDGITMRDYFAAKAMQALIHVQVATKQAQTTETAYEWADAMLRAREGAK